MNAEVFMRLAIEEARKSKTPFGAVIVKDNQIVERSHVQLLQSNLSKDQEARLREDFGS